VSDDRYAESPTRWKRGNGASQRVPGYHQWVFNIAVLVVDMLNAYRHRDADLLAVNVATIVDPLAGLIDQARTTTSI
jgi:hypothetical protein